MFNFFFEKITKKLLWELFLILLGIVIICIGVILITMGIPYIGMFLEKHVGNMETGLIIMTPGALAIIVALVLIFRHK